VNATVGLKFFTYEQLIAVGLSPAWNVNGQNNEIKMALAKLNALILAKAIFI
jgi:hypothetical protein